MRTLHLHEPRPRKWTFPLLGALLALGAPLGMVAFRCIAAGNPPTPTCLLHQIRADFQDVIYLTISAPIVFIILGRILGAREDKLAASSITDPLTRLYNRRHIDARLAEEIARATRHEGQVALLLVDVDHLKAINDRDGHEAGDAALLRVADILRRTCRATDLAARYGGDEFLVLLPSTTAAQGAELAERIRAALRRDASAPTVSIGIADLTLSTMPKPDALFEAADAALYKAKEAGRDQACVASARAFAPDAPATDVAPP